MVFDVKALLPKERKELDSAKLKEYAEYYSKTMQEKFGYLRREENAEAFDTIAAYMATWYGAEKGECDFPKRGLFLFGEKGTGKTTAMQLFSGFCEVDYITVLDLTKAFSLGSHKSFWALSDEYNGNHLIVDDLGGEDFTKSYGNEVPLADFIRQRERLWHEKKLLTFFTSNAKKRDEIAERYGSSVCSRILGMCEFVHFKGDDNRIKRRNAK